ncbi:MAG: hypothetical protein EB075_03985 [Bacteroidetes bacterium]|nr:hypothetical protein [Bacteroidota bacterium]
MTNLTLQEYMMARLGLSPDGAAYHMRQVAAYLSACADASKLGSLPTVGYTSDDPSSDELTASESLAAALKLISTNTSKTGYQMRSKPFSVVIDFDANKADVTSLGDDPHKAEQTVSDPEDSHVVSGGIHPTESIRGDGQSEPRDSTAGDALPPGIVNSSARTELIGIGVLLVMIALATFFVVQWQRGQSGMEPVVHTMAPDTLSDMATRSTADGETDVTSNQTSFGLSDSTSARSASTPSEPMIGPYVVVVGSMMTESLALQALQDGFNLYPTISTGAILPPVRVNDTTRYRAVLGSFNSEADAERFLRETRVLDTRAHWPVKLYARGHKVVQRSDL